MRQIIVKIKTGFFSFFSGFVYLKKHRLGKYLIMPGIIGMLSMAGIIVLYYLIINTLFELLIDGLGGIDWISNSKAYIQSNAGFVILMWEFSLVAIEFFMALFTTIMSYRIIVPIVISPFTGPLLDRIESIETAQQIQTSFKDDLRNILRSIYIGLRSGVWGLVFLIMGLCLGPFDIVLNGIYQGYSLGRSSWDTVLEKHFDSIRSQDIEIKKWKWEITGHGLAYFLFLLIPIVGVFLAPVISLTGSAQLFYRSKKI